MRFFFLFETAQFTNARKRWRLEGNRAWLLARNNFQAFERNNQTIAFVSVLMFQIHYRKMTNKHTTKRRYCE